MSYLYRRAVISLGGSVFTRKLDEVEELVSEIKGVSEQLEKLVVVVGAGKLKTHIEACSEAASEAEKDIVGIQATRLNAAVLKSYLRGLYRTPESVEEVPELLENHDVLVMGGTEPGHSTDSVAALVAELIDADVYFDATTVDGVYSADPNSDSNASKIDRMSFRELAELVSEKDVSAGGYSLIDLTAVRILQRSGIRAFVVDGTEPGSIISVFKEESRGTEVFKRG